MKGFLSTALYLAGCWVMGKGLKLMPEHRRQVSYASLALTCLAALGDEPEPAKPDDGNLFVLPYQPNAPCVVDMQLDGAVQ